jgi:hypothetical protein
MKTEKLFSYGTLRYANVQRATFGRTLSGNPDVLLGFRKDMMTISDPTVLAISHEKEHPILRKTGNPQDRVEGIMLDVTEDELAQADSYEVEAYARTRVTLASGTDAWAYVSVLDAERT